jgi:hypothetical protein
MAQDNLKFGVGGRAVNMKDMGLIDAIYRLKRVPPNRVCLET